MKIYTSYFAREKQLLDRHILPIAICAKVPDWYKGIVYQSLAPSYDCLMQYKKDYDEQAYKQRYYREVISRLKLDNVLAVLSYNAQKNGYDEIALLCYEKPDSFCHRHLVAQWFDLAGIECKEYEFE